MQLDEYYVQKTGTPIEKQYAIINTYK